MRFVEQRVNHQIGMESLQKRKDELRRVSTVGGQDKKHDANNQADESLKINFLLRGETQIALIRDFRVIIDEANDRKTEKRKKRKQDKRIGQIRPKENRHCRGKNDEHAAHGRRTRFLLVRLGALLANELADLQFAEIPDKPGTKDQRQKHRRKARVHGPHGDVTENIQRAEVVLQRVVKEVIKHLSAVPRAP